MGDIEFRPVDVDSAEMDAYFATVGLVFKDSTPLTPERVEFRRPTYRTQRVTAAFDRKRVVGTYRSWDTHVTAPGGALVGADAVSTVTVSPTHRRRGILTRLIRDDLAAAAARGTPVAVLIAAEAPIYGRYGFGAATETVRWRVDARAAVIAPHVPRGGALEITTEAHLRDVAPDVFTRSRRPGAIDVSDATWDWTLGVVEMPGRPHKPGVAVLHRDAAGTPQGYLIYKVEDRWEDRACRTVVSVQALAAVTDEAYATLWGLLTELDTVATVDAEERAVDEVLPGLLTDARAARQVARCDFQWSRLLDVPAALSARAYETPGSITVEVLDALGLAAGRYTVEADGTGAGSCTRTDRDPDVVLPVDVLSSLWLGGGNLRAAAVAGHAVQETPGGLARLGALLRTTQAPWTDVWF